MAKAGEDQVNRLLCDVRKAIEENRSSLVSREKNMATLAHFGWRLSEVKEELSNLTYSNYVSGPEIDRAEPKSDNLWIFKSYIDRTPIYIKLKVKYQTDSRVVIISFHISDHWQ